MSFFISYFFLLQLLLTMPLYLVTRSIASSRRGIWVQRLQYGMLVNAIAMLIVSIAGAYLVGGVDQAMLEDLQRIRRIVLFWSVNVLVLQVRCRWRLLRYAAQQAREDRERQADEDRRRLLSNFK